MVSLVAHMVKNLPAMQEIQVQSLGWKDPLETEMATHSSVIAWRTSWIEDPGSSELESMFSESDTTDQLILSFNPYTDSS